MAVETSESSKATELNFNALYLDTNILTGFGWPIPSVQLENLVLLDIVAHAHPPPKCEKGHPLSVPPIPPARTEIEDAFSI